MAVDVGFTMHVSETQVINYRNVYKMLKAVYKCLKITEPLHHILLKQNKYYTVVPITF